MHKKYSMTGACRRERPRNKKNSNRKVLNYQNKSFRTRSTGSFIHRFPA